MGPLVGIGITHSAAIRTHTDSRTAPSIKTSIQRYSALSRALLADGYKVSLFTNGAQEDEEMLDLVVKELHRQNVSDVVRHDRPQTPLGLIEQIGRFDALISHRLHANIVAYSLGVPAIALSWDSKVDAFLESVGLGSRLADGTLASIDAIQNKLGRALAETDTPNNPVNIGTDARQAIREVLESVLDELKHPAA
ncbi:Polysaccharide pyruvyl transferase [Pelagibacterium halotolerans]|nr:Polysaccharide pyruvyl transferase [Pelagibacterium halotolerans]